MKKEKSKKLYYQNKLQKCENNMKATWNAIKETIGKSKVFHKNFSKTLRINKTSITDKNVITVIVNDF